MNWVDTSSMNKIKSDYEALYSEVKEARKKNDPKSSGSSKSTPKITRRENTLNSQYNIMERDRPLSFNRDKSTDRLSISNLEIDGDKSWNDFDRIALLQPSSLMGSLVNIKTPSVADSLENVSDIKDAFTNQNSLTELQQSLEKQSVQRNEAEIELFETQKDLEEKENNLRSLHEQLMQSRVSATQLQDKLATEKNDLQRAKSDLERLKYELDALRKENESQRQINTRFREEIKDQNIAMKNLQEELNSVKKENSQLAKQKSTLKVKVQSLEEQNVELKKEADALQLDTGRLRIGLKSVNKELEALHKVNSELTRERDTLRLRISRLMEEREVQNAKIRAKEREEQAASRELEKITQELNVSQRLAKENEKEKEKRLASISEISSKLKDTTDQLNNKEMEIMKLSKKITELEFQAQREAKRIQAIGLEKESITRQLMETKEELIDEKNRNFCSNQEVAVFRSIGMQQEEELRTTKKELQQRRLEASRNADNANKYHTQLEDTRKELDAKMKEVNRLQEMLDESQNKILHLEKANEKVHLVEIREEKSVTIHRLESTVKHVSSLEENLNQTNELKNRTEQKCSQLEDDLRILRVELGRLKGSLETRNGQLEIVDELRRELYHTQRELLKEQTRSRALEEELETPLNIHRWRLLEGSDPEKSRLLGQVVSLQRHLVAKCKETAGKSIQLEEAKIVNDKLASHIDKTLIIEDGETALEKLRKAKKELQQKDEKIKSLMAEANMSSSMLAVHQNQIDQLKREIAELKKESYRQRKFGDDTKSTSEYKGDEFESLSDNVYEANSQVLGNKQYKDSSQSQVNKKIKIEHLEQLISSSDHSLSDNDIKKVNKTNGLRSSSLSARPATTGQRTSRQGRLRVSS